MSHSAADAQPASGRGALLAIIAALAIVIVIGGIYILRQGSAASDQLAQMQSKLDGLSQRTATLEARPVPQPPPPPPPPPDLRPLEQRLAALENKPAPVAQLDQAGHQEIASLAGRIDAIGARQNLLGTQEQTDIGKVNQQITDGLAKVSQQETADIGKIDSQLTAMNTRLDAAAKSATEITALDTRQARTAQLQAAAASLAAGHALGAIQGAPPALAQFATKAPPTEADLRLSFDQAAAAARKAGQPYAETQPFLSRVWDRFQSGLVVREGDRVIVGDAVSGVLDHAKRQLDAGDLPGAVAALDGLAGPAAQAMAPWRAQAQSLIDARAALISAARG